jgi:regulation of enolase protein 1 (concanavalin A-like superfamily)
MEGLDEFAWLNPPEFSQRRSDGLFVRTAEKTDFWRGTFYGFHPDSGHVFGRWVDGDFTATATFAGDYRELYDQAGVMVRANADHWVKAGIEFSDGVKNLSAVVTNGNSDWSVIPLPGHEGDVTVRVTRHGDAVRVQYRDGAAWRMARLAWLKPHASLFVGMMCCSPLRAGFEVVFKDFTIGPPIARDLHEPQPA